MKDRSTYHKKYYAEHKPHLAALKAHYHKGRHGSDLDYRLRAVLRTIVQRCEDPRHTSWKYYGAKGIKNFLTLGDLKLMWARDGADQMKRPSIDRRHSSLDYAPQNCCFIEHADNARKARLGYRKFPQKAS